MNFKRQILIYSFGEYVGNLLSYIIAKEHKFNNCLIYFKTGLKAVIIEL